MTIVIILLILIGLLYLYFRKDSPIETILDPIDPSDTPPGYDLGYHYPADTTPLGYDLGYHYPADTTPLGYDLDYFFP